MITIGMNYKVRESKQETFEAMFRRVIEALAGAPGHDHSRLFRDVLSEREYLIVSEWNDIEAFNAFIASDQFRKVATWGRDILEGPPRHDVYEHQTAKRPMYSAVGRQASAASAGDAT